MKNVILVLALISTIGYAQSKCSISIEPKPITILSIPTKVEKKQIPLEINYSYYSPNPIIFQASGVSAEFSSRKKQNDNLYRLYDRQYKDEKPVVISQEIKANFVTWYNELNYLEQFEYFIQGDVEWMIRR